MNLIISFDLPQKAKLKHFCIRIFLLLSNSDSYHAHIRPLLQNSALGNSAANRDNIHIAFDVIQFHEVNLP
jgi:hypothetical protein